MKIREEVLVPIAHQRIVDSAARRDITDSDFREEVAKELFQRHCGQGRTKYRAKVEERTWDNVRPQERGKYRKMFDEALVQYQS